MCRLHLTHSSCGDWVCVPKSMQDCNSLPFLCSFPVLFLLCHPPFSSDYNRPLPFPVSHQDPIKKVIHTPAVWDKALCLYHWWTVLLLSYFEFGFLPHAQPSFLFTCVAVYLLLCVDIMNTHYEKLKEQYWTYKTSVKVWANVKLRILLPTR